MVYVLHLPRCLFAWTLVWSFIFILTIAVDQQEIVNLIIDFTNNLDKSLSSKMRISNLGVWNYQSDINDVNMKKMIKSQKEFSDWNSDKLEQSKNLLKLTSYLIENPNTERQIASSIKKLKKYISTNPFSIDDKKLQSELLKSTTKLGDLYNNAFVLDDQGAQRKPLQCEPDLTHLFATSHDYDRLEWAWLAWRAQFGKSARSEYKKGSNLLNKAAKENGYEDAGDAWRSSFYRPEDDIINITSDLYKSIKPLYEQLHAYTRRKLIEKYPNRNIPEDGPIPAHLLGNMWAQQWNGIYDILKPYPGVESEKEDIIKDKGISYHEMYKMAEDFFTSLGFEPMTSTFWNKSVLFKPSDRKVDCHGSASDFMTHGDYRIMFCASKTLDSLATIHHEMGHIEYFMSYRNQPTMYRDGANAAFHEAVGDTIGLSFASSKHKHLLNFTKPESDPQIKYKKKINRIMLEALNKIAFLPFALVIDNWRWGVFNGSIQSDRYNEQWWTLRYEFQGIAPPRKRDESTLDAASKYHVSFYIPYIRYFLSFLAQFQFYEALCKKSGYEGPLDDCDFYGSKVAGETLKKMLSLGSSKEWPEAMRLITGSPSFDTDAILKYFSPLEEWLKLQNRGHKVGW